MTNSSFPTDIPLFLQQEEIFTLYILNNDIILCGEFHVRDKYSSRPFELLHQMASIPSYISSFPSILFHHFNNNPFPKSLHSYNCLISVDLSKEYGSYVFCLEADLGIQKTPSPTVRLYNLVFQGQSLNIEVSLTPFDAFLTFSNLCVNCIWEGFYSILRRTGYLEYNRSAISVDSSYSGNKIIHEFCLDYLDFLEQSILENKLTPFDIFRNSGFGAIILLSNMSQVKTFIHEALDALLDVPDVPSNIHLIYYSLYNILQNTSLWIYPIVKEFSEKNRKILAKLRTKIVNQYMPSL
jgi:hypothetical protein